MTKRNRHVIMILISLVACVVRAAVESSAISVDDVKWRKFKPVSEVYIDATLQFTPSVDAFPEVDPGKDKLAIWLNVDSATSKTNLCVYSSYADLRPAGAALGGKMLRIGAMGAETFLKPRIFKLTGTGSLKPSQWYRLTVRTIRDVTRRGARTGDRAKSLLGFQVYLDGALLSSDEASFTKNYAGFASGTQGWLNPAKDRDLVDFLQSGTVFVSLCGESGDDSVTGVGFRGEGALEDVDISGEVPVFLGITSLDFTLSLSPLESPIAAILSE